MREIAAQGLVCGKGLPADDWIGVVDGLIKVATVSSAGRSVTFTGVARNGWVGEGSMLKDEPRRYDVIALRDSRIAFMPRQTFQWLLETSLPFNCFLIRQLNERLGQFIAIVETDRLLGPDARVARCLGQLFNPILYPNLDGAIEISQTEIGYLTGLSRQRVNRALSVLEQAGLLRAGYRGVMVTDVPGLLSFES